MQRKEETSLFRLCSPCAADLSPRGNFFGSFAPWDFFFFLFPPFRGAGEAGGVSGCTWCCVWGGSLSSRSTSVQREGWECLWAFVWGALPLLLLLRGRAKWELPARCRPSLPASPTWLSLPNSHRTFHDVGIQERLRGLAPACYPPVVPVLRIEEHGRIREPGLGGVALVDVAVVLALAPLPVRGQEEIENKHYFNFWCFTSGQLSLVCYISTTSRSRRDRSQSSDRYRSRHDRSRRERSRSVDRCRSRRQHTRSPARRRDWYDRSRSPALSNRSRSGV